jgi:hypothetical protein
MDSSNLPKSFRRLLNYYSLLQFSHIFFLSRAGLIFLTQGRIPFPAQPPAAGWEAETIPFLFGMGAVDALAAGLALYAGWKMAKDSVFYHNIWFISVCIAATSAVIYCFGTLPSGAWQANPIGYGIVAFVFSPLLILVIQFIRIWPKNNS